jgi:hypothetical protein
MIVGETKRKMLLRHMAVQEQLIARQDVIIERLRKIGAPLEDAIDLLAAMQEFLEDVRAHMARISNQNTAKPGHLVTDMSGRL